MDQLSLVTGFVLAFVPQASAQSKEMIVTLSGLPAQ